MYAYSELPPEVIEAFRQASMFDLMLVAHACATHISFLLNDKSGFSGDSRVCQGFVKGNVAVLPQDTLMLHTVIPPDRGEICDAMCTLLIGHDVTPTRENIVSLGPILVNKSVVRTLANFLVARNEWY